MKPVLSTLEALQQQSEAVECQARLVAQSALKSYEASLRDSLKNVVDTLRTDADKVNCQFLQELRSQHGLALKQIATQQKSIELEINKQLSTTLRLIKIPFLMTVLALTLVLILFFWMAPISDIFYKTQVVYIGKQKFLYVTDKRWMVCSGSQAHLYPCKKEER